MLPGFERCRAGTTACARARSPGQTEPTYRQVLTLDAALVDTRIGVSKMLGKDPVFAPRIEAYMLYEPSTFNAYPCAYLPDSGMIMHLRTGMILWDFDLEEQLTCNKSGMLYYKEVHEAHAEYLKEDARTLRYSQQPSSVGYIRKHRPEYNKHWFTWLLSEYIRELPGEEPVERPQPTYPA
jgi:hypothetical protein